MGRLALSAAKPNRHWHKAAGTGLALCPANNPVQARARQKARPDPVFLQSRIQLEDTSMARRALSFRGFLDIFTAH
jgi:hypothetical protein